MQITRDPDQNKWNKFIAYNSSPASFLQTWEWGEFQKSLGLKIHRLAVENEGEYQTVAQAIVRPLPLGRTYLEVTKGPVMQVVSSKLISSIVEELKKIGEAENSVLIRVNPPYESDLQLTTYNFTTPAILMRQMEPEDTVLVDLTKSEEDLLARMHEKSRYNIRLAVKKGVQVFDKSVDAAAFEKFLELIGQTAKRDGITVWPRARFEKFREEFLLNSSPLRGEGQGGGEKPYAILLTGEYEGQTLAAAIVMLYGDTGTYLYAASSAENRNANVPSLVLWEAIRQAKARGKKYYDMWGIAPVGADESHPWSGITRFKSRYITVGETGKEMHYTGTWDLVLDGKYYHLFKFGKAVKNILK